ncbi:MAG TPA: putative DNA-binding domain-containing protein [Candidatus Binatia bacterium]|nr:putative DNA-binding domain-containing protein [Candidatus Binatia bacterium]
MKAFQKLQLRFAAHLRDPSRNAAPDGIEPRRIRIYAELLYNNVEGFLATGFPVLRAITPEARWHAMARDFFSRHRCRDPLFHGIAAELLKYLERVRRDPGDPPFLRELAHYEWVELALQVSAQRPDRAAADARGDLLAGTPVLSPLAWPLTYRFPVHRIGPGFQPLAPPPQPTHLVVWRNRDDAVKFMELNAVSARLLQLLSTRPAAGAKLLARIARELKHPDPQQVIAQGAALLVQLRERDIVLGTASSSGRGPARAARGPRARKARRQR